MTIALFLMKKKTNAKEMEMVVFFIATYDISARDTSLFFLP